MMSGDLRWLDEEDNDDESGLELSLGLSIGRRNSVSSLVERRPAAAAAEVVAQTPAGEVASMPPDEPELRRKREMHAIKRQEARRKLEEKQIRKGGGGGGGLGTASRGGGVKSNSGLSRTCSAQGERGRARSRESREAEDEDDAHNNRHRKVSAKGGQSTSATPPASRSPSLSGSTTTPSHRQIPPAENSNNDPHSSAPNPIPPTNHATPYPFTPMMPIPFPLHPAQFVHLGAAGGFPYMMPCWNPQLASAGPEDPNRSMQPLQQQPAAPQPGRGSSFRPFRQPSGTPCGQEGGAGVARTAAAASANGNGGGGMKRMPSLTGSQGSGFSAISDYRGDLDIVQATGGRGDSNGSGGAGDNTQPQANNSAADGLARSGPTMPVQSSPSRSINTSPPASDHSVSSNPTTTSKVAKKLLPATDAAQAPPSERKEPHRGAPAPERMALPATPASASSSIPVPEKATTVGPRSANTSTAAAVSTTNRRPDAAGPARPRTMPYVCAKGTGPNGRTVTGFLYKFDDKDKVSIVCVCHGSCFTPEEFVRHAGATDVDNPLRHILMIEEPPEHRVMVPSA